MDIKHIEFFLACVEYKSLGKAAQHLYTSQPNVSKVIREMEAEMKMPLFERTTKGLRLTEAGRSVYEYAQNVSQNMHLLVNAPQHLPEEKLCISSYHSHILARILAAFCRTYPQCPVEYRPGTLEEIIEDVYQRYSGIGIVYVSEKQKAAFDHVLSHRNLEFQELDRRKACVFVGERNLFYEKETITAKELADLKFMTGLSDFFAIEHEYEMINVGPGADITGQTMVHTNSEYLMEELLTTTDLAAYSIDLVKQELTDSRIRSIRVTGKDTELLLGYIKEKGCAISGREEMLLDECRKILKNDKSTNNLL